MTYVYASDIEHARTIPAWIERDGVEVQNPDFQALEAKARRLARREGLRLEKCRTRNPDAYCFGGYMLIDGERNFIVSGSMPLAWSLDLGGVFEELQPEPISSIRLVT